MRSLTWTDKMLVQEMCFETLERAFNKEMSKEIYLACSEAIFSEVEHSEWFQDDNPILFEHVEVILGIFIRDALKLMFEEGQE